MKNSKVRSIGDRVDVTAGIEVTKNGKLEYGDVETVVSNSMTDRYGESINVNGIDTSNIMKNPVVLWAHDYQDLPIGKLQKLWKSKGNLMARFHLDYDIYDFADTIYKMILRGTISAVSIGGIVKAFLKREDGSTDYQTIDELEMVELSVVPVGAHPDALIINKSMKEQMESFINQTKEPSEVRMIKKVTHITY